MPLVRQTAALPFFSGGLDSKTAPFKLLPPKLLDCENVIFNQPGQLNKRNGFSENSTLIAGSGTPIGSGNALMTFKNELLTASIPDIYSLNVSDQQQVYKGIQYSAYVTSRVVIADAYNEFSPDGNTHPNGLQLYAWESSQGGAFYEIIDSTTGQIIVPPTLLNVDAIKPKVLILGNSFIIITYNTGTEQLVAYQIPVAIPYTAPIVGVLAGASDDQFAVNTTNPNFDATVINNNLYWAFNSDTMDGGITFSYSIGTNPLVVAGTNIVTTDTGPSPIAIFAATQTAGTQGVGVAFAQDVSTVISLAYQVYVQGFFNLSLGGGSVVLSTTLPISITVMENGIGSSLADVQIEVYYTTSAGATQNYYVSKSLISDIGASPSSPQVFQRGVGLSGKAFQHGDFIYVPVAFQTQDQATYFLLDEQANIVAKFLYQSGGGIPVRSDSMGVGAIPETAQVTSTQFRFPMLFQDSITTRADNIILTQTGVKAQTLDFNNIENSYNTAEIGNLLQIGGGYVSIYDGISSTELGFHVYPEPISDSLGSSGNLSDGQYQFTVTYQWIDNQGQTHISAPAIPTTFTATSGQKATYTAPTLRLTSKSTSAPITRAPVTIHFWRTIANGTIFYNASSALVPATSGSINAPIINSVTTDTVTMVDNLSDATIQTGQVIYTTGGVQDHIPPNATSDMVVWQNRIIALDSTNPLQLWYTPPVTPGAPPAFSDNFIFNVDPRGGPVTALGVIDEQLVIYKGTSIFYVSGTGPDATANNYNWTDPQQITTDVGCSNPRSIVITPLGNMFQSAKGIYLLDRSLIAEYIGAEVQRYDTDIITSAQLIPNAQRIQFTTDGNDGFLVYDYYVKQWATFPKLAAVDSVIWNGEFTWLRADGTSFTETPGVYVDPGSNYIKIKTTLSWISTSQLQGFQRIYRFFVLANYDSPHQLICRIAYNFIPSWVDNFTISPNQPETWGSDSVWGGNTSITEPDNGIWGGTGVAYQFRVNPTIQKNESMLIQLEESQNSTNGEGLSLVGIMVEFGQKSGGMRLPAAQTIG